MDGVSVVSSVVRIRGARFHVAILNLCQLQQERDDLSWANSKEVRFHVLRMLCSHTSNE